MLGGPCVSLAFIRSPSSPSAAVRPPKGDDWLHEPNWDGFRFQIIKDGSDVRLYSTSGADYSNKLPGMRKSFAELPTNSAPAGCLVERLGVPRHSLQRRSLQNFNIPAIFTCNRQWHWPTTGGLPQSSVDHSRSYRRSQPRLHQTHRRLPLRHRVRTLRHQ